MSAVDETARPAIGSVVSTACGGLIRLEANTPQSFLRGRRIYFCLLSCKESFDRDPKTSCLVGDSFLEDQG